MWRFNRCLLLWDSKRGSIAHDAELSIRDDSGRGMVREMRENCSYCTQNRRVSFLWDMGLSVTDGDKVTVMELEVE